MPARRIAAAQTPEFRGNVEQALRHLTDVAGQALAAGVSLVCFPEGFLQGYLTDEESAREAAMDLASCAFGQIARERSNDGLWTHRG
jgi:predicted amidohydrolase